MRKVHSSRKCAHKQCGCQLSQQRQRGTAHTDRIRLPSPTRASNAWPGAHTSRTYMHAHMDMVCMYSPSFQDDYTIRYICQQPHTNLSSSSHMERMRERSRKSMALTAQVASARAPPSADRRDSMHHGSATVCMDGRRPTACIDGRRIARRLRCGRRRERQAGAHSIWSSSSSSPRLAPRTEPPCPLAARWLCPPCAVAVDGMCCARCMRSRRSLSIR